MIPRFREEWFDVALEHWELFLVISNAIATDEGTESHVAMCTLVALAINAEGIELIFLHLLFQEGGCILGL